MSSTLGVRQWFQRGTVSAVNNNHTRDFGITFAEDDSSSSGGKALPPMPPLIPLGGGRRKRRRSSDNNRVDTVSGSVIMLNSDTDNHNEKLLRLFGGGDSDSGVSVHSVALERAVDHKERSIELAGGKDVVAKVTDVCSESEPSGGSSRCTVLLDPIPTDLLASLNTVGCISAEKAARTCHQTQEWEESLPMISDNEVQGLLQDLVDVVGEEGEEEGGEDMVPELARCQRQQESLLQPPPLTSNAIDYNDVTRDATVATSSSRKLRHRKSETPRKAVRRRRERRSSSSGGGGGNKRRKRSTSSSTTSSTCSTTSHRHKHHHKHRHRHRTPEPEIAPPPNPRPRVNPIFVWVKQDDTRIVEVLCEDYDKRNRIRLTKTPHGWRAFPRTERFSSIPSLSAPSIPPSSTPNSTESSHEAEPLTSNVITESSTNNDVTTLVPEDDKLLPQDEPLSEQTKADDEQEMTLNETLEESSCIDDTLDKPLSSHTSEQPLDHDDDSADEQHMDVDDDIEYQTIDKDNNNEILEDSSKENDKSSELETECSLSKLKDKVVAESVNDTVHKVETDASVAEAIEPTVEQEIKQVVQKDDVVLVENSETEVDETTKQDYVMEDDLLPTDLSIPKKCDATCQPPKPRSMAAILRTPKLLTTTLLSNLNRVSRPGISPALPEAAITPGVQPAHQTKLQHKSMFLESLLSTPRMCHQTNKPIVDTDSIPLDLGKPSVRASSSPTVSSSETKNGIVKKDVEEPKLKCKVEDITLKNLLSRRPEHNRVLKVEEVDVRKETKKMSESTKAHKSRLLELLTTDPGHATATSTPDLDPLTQLKKILSDPDMAIPDPLLVPRDRLQDLVSCPAKEIPRLLTLRPELRLPEALAYPSLLQDPNLLVVSISYLQNLLRSPEKPGKNDDSYSTLGAFLEWQRYQSHQQILESHLKQQAIHKERDIDSATAQALNQMMWLPYLNQLEASAMACGNNQEFLNMLNMVFPNPSYPNGFPGGQYPPGMIPNIPIPSDYKSQLELQQTLAMWQEAMMQAAMSPNKPSGLLTGNDMANRINMPKKCNSSARTSPMGPNLHPQSRHSHTSSHRSLNEGYPSHQQFNLQPPTSRHPPNRPTQQQQHHHQQQQHQQQQQHRSLLTQNPTKKTKIEVGSIKNDTIRPTVTCKSLLNLLSRPRREEELMKRSHSTPSLEVPSPRGHLVATTLGKPAQAPAMNLSGSRRTSTTDKVAKLKVKQHLVDPTLKPKLLKQEIKPEVGVAGDDKVSASQLHPNLWHPLFGSQKPSYNSPWQWTTVTVNGE